MARGTKLTKESQRKNDNKSRKQRNPKKDGFGESVPPCHGYRDARKRIGGIRGTLPRIQGIVKSTKRDPWQSATDSGSWSHSYKYQVVVHDEDERRAKMAEVEDGERDMRRRNKTSRLGMGGLDNY
ncbi:hypothetical protein PIB30_008978 [Stylosanthes scabra]|uniref:Uncharacterized protein n=1 Tax=Stylosanthes scabra TaxID=79078 RepID=A0ABU6S4N7_9FABA|nr:hypothetical protein [Stylosanthes scabra]